MEIGNINPRMIEEGVPEVKYSFKSVGCEGCIFSLRFARHIVLKGRVEAIFPEYTADTFVSREDFESIPPEELRELILDRLFLILSDEKRRLGLRSIPWRAGIMVILESRWNHNLVQKWIPYD
jgi:hypothetical protein